ncbi:MAG: MATE family efflux transporter, partial [Oscillospiraceae bacterium]|nr:MATE family efflux transporter [Oscillospiraceae bacterium]
MHIHLSERFSYGKLLRFTLPSIIMMIFTSLYGVADGFFVSNFAGKNPFTAVNFIMPFLMILGAMGFMFGTGGSALIAKTMGEGDSEEANRRFSLLIYTTIVCGAAVAVLGMIFIRPVAMIMGAEGELLENCVLYGRIILIALPFYMLQFEFQSFFSTAEKPRLGLAVTVAAGMANIIGDALLVAVFRFGIVGAAAATAISQAMGGLIPLIYFAFPNKSRLKLTKTRLDFRVLGKVCTNGSSELMSNVSMSLVNMLYNVQLMKYAGEDGVAAYGVLMYVGLVFLAAFIGYSVGTAPIVSFHYGAEDHDELKSLLKKSSVIISAFAVIMFIAAECLARPLAEIFTGYDEGL